MTAFVVDTNVAIVANGRDTHADERCRLTCVETLERLTTNEKIAMDDKGAILEEYARHLSYSGMPGVGDKFFKHIVDTQYKGTRVHTVTVTPCEDVRRGFEELPENTFDPSDRRFLAVAVVANAVVLNATDSDWGEHETLMDSLGVEVTQLCPRYASRTRQEQ